MSPALKSAAVGEIYDASSFQPSSSIGYLVNRVRTELLAAIDKALEPFDVTSAQYIIMGHVAYNLADSASGLCKGIAYDPGAMTRMVDRLEAKGLVQRVREQDDRRKVRLELTKEGRAAFPGMMERVVEVLNSLLKGFTKAEASQLKDFLKRMLANAGA
jgi:DNA-binding MarR family transcriptional regulator